MLFSEAAQLIYDGAGMHEMKNLASRQSSILIASRTTNHALAEWFMRKIDYANNFNQKARIAVGNEAIGMTRRASRQINHIHHNSQVEIESKWQRPSMTDEEAQRLLFQEHIERPIADSIKSRAVELVL